ncbi:MAG TPA: hypothetical protein VES39_09980, partial [Rhodospirillales bacterium]|nr:hypothetical protein [Rhodospirillales bacterium]
NAADVALASESEGGSAPTRTYPHMPWRDHASGIRYRRNSANTAWLIDEVYAATTDPTTNDDVSLGFSVGVRWTNATAKRDFVCADATDGAAVWHALGRAASRAKAPPEIANNAGDANNDIDVAAGSCLSDEGVPLTLAAGITKRLDAAWAAGTGNGGIDTGSKATSTWYSLWLIGKADGTVDALFSVEATAPTMPSGYVYKRRLGWVLTDGSGNIVAFTQAGDRFRWASPRQDAAAASIAATATLLTISAPPLVAAEMTLAVSHASAIRYVIISGGDEADTAPTSTVHSVKTGASGAAWPWFLTARTNASRQIRHRADSTSGVLAVLNTLSWIDRRGRDQ